MFLLLTFLAGITLGIIAGIIFAKKSLKPKYAGILRLYKSEPDEGTSLYLELHDSAESLHGHEFVTFKTVTVEI